MMKQDGNALRYEPIPAMTREEAQRQLSMGGSVAAQAIYSIALHDPDDSFAEATCLEAIGSDDPALRFAAIGAIGEMTVFAGRKIDFESAEMTLLALERKHPELASRIQDARDDFEFAQSKAIR